MTLDPDIIFNAQLKKQMNSRAGSEMYSMFQKTGVPASSEFFRIEKLARRSWTEQQGAQLAEYLSAAIRQPGSRATLKPVQAIALWEMYIFGGLFAPITVGGGKTLISFLAPWFLNAKLPVLIVPANLARKTDKERNQYLQLFQLPPAPYVISYEKLSRQGAAKFLFEYKPDALIFDEGHKARGKAVNGRVKRFLAEQPFTKVAIMSGTVTKRSIRDYSELLTWCLDSPPIPQVWSEVEAWANCLDEKVGEGKRIAPGALERLMNSEERLNPNRIQAVRQAYKRRLIETPGVVAVSGSDVDASLNIHSEILEPPKNVVDVIHYVRSTWTRPDGWLLADAPQVWATIRQLATGFYYRWDPLPPAEWVAARRWWASEVREALKHLGRYHIDTELQVVNAINRPPWGRKPDYWDDLVAARNAWVSVRDTFRPNKVPEWIDPFSVDYALEWGRKEKGLIWVEYQEYGAELERRGMPYYGEGGIRVATKEYADDAKKGPIALGIRSNMAGRNMQRFSENLIMHPPPNGLQWEQILGRTHRFKQESDTVNAKVVLSCAEHYGAMINSRNDAIYQRDTLTGYQKLLIATWDIEDCTRKEGPAWQK